MPKLPYYTLRSERSVTEKPLFQVTTLTRFDGPPERLMSWSTLQITPLFFVVVVVLFYVR